MEDTETEDFNIIKVSNNFYTRTTSKLRGSLRFSIPKPIVFELGLQASDHCYFIQQEDGFCLAFKEYPEGISEKAIKHRQLSKQGDYDTLYICIPPAIKNKYQFSITAVQLMQPKGYRKHEWLVKPITTDYI